MATVGIISDTHGLLRPEAVAALRGVDLILHAGDIGSLEVIAQLEKIAPVVAVRGNIDTQSWAEPFPHTESVTVEGKRVYLLHSIQQLDINPAAENYHVVVSGHSHKPSIRADDSVIYLNPGSAGRKRFKLPISVAKLHIDATNVAAEIIELAV